MSNDMTDYQLKNLEILGWDSFFQEYFQRLSIPDAVPARVISESKNLFQVYSEYGVLAAGNAGKKS